MSADRKSPSQTIVSFELFIKNSMFLITLHYLSRISALGKKLSLKDLVALAAIEILWSISREWKYSSSTLKQYMVNYSLDLLATSTSLTMSNSL
jgi:hypothetical protein